MKNIFKVGDRVFDYHFGWGEVRKLENNGDVVVEFESFMRDVLYKQDGKWFNGIKPTLSLTEYTLQGFSQERPVDYNEYIGEWGKFWDNDDECRVIMTLEDFREDGFQTHNGFWFQNFKPLTEEQIKALEL